MTLTTRFEQLVKKHNSSDLKSNTIKNSAKQILTHESSKLFDSNCREETYDKQIDMLETQMIKQMNSFDDQQQRIWIANNEIRECKRNLLQLQGNSEIVRHSNASGIKG